MKKSYVLVVIIIICIASYFLLKWDKTSEGLCSCASKPLSTSFGIFNAKTACMDMPNSPFPINTFELQSSDAKSKLSFIVSLMDVPTEKNECPTTAWNLSTIANERVCSYSIDAMHTDVLFGKQYKEYHITIESQVIKQKDLDKFLPEIFAWLEQIC